MHTRHTEIARGSSHSLRDTERERKAVVVAVAATVPVYFPLRTSILGDDYTSCCCCCYDGRTTAAVAVTVAGA